MDQVLIKGIWRETISATEKGMMKVMNKVKMIASIEHWRILEVDAMVMMDRVMQGRRVKVWSKAKAKVMGRMAKDFVALASRLNFIPICLVMLLVSFAFSLF